MKKTAAHSATSLSNTQTSHIETVVLGREFLDTAWRIALPVVFFALLGFVGDQIATTKPWLTLLGVVVGFMAAGVLVKQQPGSSHKA
jgi:F0F1-type ATP synthase assembly protein I